MRKKFYRGMALLLIALFLVPLHGFSVVSSASDEAQVFEGHRYQVFDESMTWTEAKAYCEELGGHLATVTSQEENDFIAGLIADGTKNLYWLGGYKESGQEDVWRWVTGEAWNYANWDVGEPNDLGGGESYVEMIRIADSSARTPEKWNDIKNNSSNGFYAVKNKGLVCEWDTLTEKRFPEGFEYTSDVLSSLSGKIELEIYQDAFGIVKGRVMYLSELLNCMFSPMGTGTHGLCYGVEALTATLNKYKDAVNTFYNNDTGNFHQSICSIAPNSYSSFFQMTSETYIKYAYIYQFDADEKNFQRKTTNDIEGLYSAVKNYVNGVGNPIVLNFRTDNSEIENHTVFVAGIEENADDIRIIVSDMNARHHEHYLVISKNDETWHCELANAQFDSDSAEFSYSFPADIVYSMGLLHANSAEKSISAEKKLSQNYLLLAAKGQVDSLQKTIDIGRPYNGDNIDGLFGLKMGWIERNNSTVDLITANETSEISVSDVNSAITLQAPANSKVAMTVDDDAQNALTLTSRVGEAVSVDFMYARDDDISTVTITGTTAAETVTAEETDTGLVVTGLNDMTVTLETADGSAETAAQVTDGAAVQITVDEENTTVSTDWTCSHPDANHDGICDNCGEDFTASCSHFCHSENKFVQFIWKILNFFYRLFGIEDMRICSCGQYHW